MGRKHRMPIGPTLLQDLPNELVAQIFWYFNDVDAVFAFSNLTHRFQCQLVENCQFFDFIAISKLKADLIM
jgi:hypothetical protein